MKIIYKNEHELILREEEISEDKYFADLECIEGKYKTKEIYENEKLTNFTTFFDFKLIMLKYCKMKILKESMLQ